MEKLFYELFTNLPKGIFKEIGFSPLSCPQFIGPKRQGSYKSNVQFLALVNASHWVDTQCLLIQVNWPNLHPSVSPCYPELCTAQAGTLGSTIHSNSQ